MYIDSHAHIYLKEFEEDLDLVIKAGKDHGVLRTYMPNIDISSIESLHQVEEKYESCKAMMGLHPCYVKEDYKSQLEVITTWIRKRDYAAIGEIGVDLYWDKTYVDEQIDAFKYQIELAKEMNLAIVIHSRDSLDLTINTVQELQDGNLKGIFHCFNGTEDQAKMISDIGFHIGIGGVITFKNAGVDKVVKRLPIDNMVLETDAPYLSPTPHRGKRNEIAYIELIAQKLSEIKEISLEEIAEVTTTNCKSIFKY